MLFFFNLLYQWLFICKIIKLSKLINTISIEKYNTFFLLSSNDKVFPSNILEMLPNVSARHWQVHGYVPPTEFPDSNCSSGWSPKKYTINQVIRVAKNVLKIFDNIPLKNIKIYLEKTSMCHQATASGERCF